MKKVTDLLKPYLSIIFGALLLLLYFNLLSFGGALLALGIIATVLAAYFLITGILAIAMGEKLSKKAKSLINLIGVSGFSAFMGVYFLLDLINRAKASKGDFGTPVGPAGWTIGILSIGASFGLLLVLVIAFAMKSKDFARIAFLFGAIFVLALLLDVLAPAGNPISLGAVVVLQVVLYGAFVGILFNVLSSLNSEEQ